jgi:hypothetical protein
MSWLEPLVALEVAVPLLDSGAPDFAAVLVHLAAADSKPLPISVTQTQSVVTKTNFFLFLLT